MSDTPLQQQIDELRARLDALSALVPPPSALPAVADGIMAEDGQIDADSAIFRSRSAPFTPEHVGRLISIRLAGPSWMVAGGYLAVTGSGFRAGDLVTFECGAQIYVRAVRDDIDGTIAAFYLVATGSAPLALDRLAQTGSTGYGTGAVLAPTWVRENLVTTIAAVRGVNQVELAAPAAAAVQNVIWGCGTDYSAAILAMVAAGEDVRLPRGIVGCAGTLALRSASTLTGRGCGVDDGDATSLMWLGPPGGIQLTMDGEGGDRRFTSCEVGKFHLIGLGSASKGLYARGISGNHLLRMTASDHTMVSIHLDYGMRRPTIMNRYDWFRVQNELRELHAHGIWIGFPNAVDTKNSVDASSFGPVHVSLHAESAGVPVLWGVSDHNTIEYIRAHGSAKAPGIELMGGNWAGPSGSRNNHFLGMDAGEGGLVARGTGFGYPAEAIIDFHDGGNGEPPPVAEPGAQLAYTDNLGRRAGFALRPQMFAELTSPYEGSVALVKDAQSNRPGAIASGGGSMRATIEYRDGQWRVRR